MQDYTLIRTGQAPLSFSGHQIVECDSKATSGPLQNRWHELRYYETAKGKRIVEIVLRTCWQGETDQHSVFVCGNDADVIQAVTAYDPCSGWQGYPDTDSYAERNTRLRATIRAGYTDMVSEFLREANVVEIVE